ncbi:MAG: hypothetical protein AAF591_06075 [Verrucomicrobiota bacterium]
MKSLAVPRKIISIAFSLGLLTLTTQPSQAVSVAFSSDPGSPFTEYTLSGSGTFSFGGFVLPSIGLNQLNFDAFNTNIGSTISGTGVMTNVTTGAIANVLSITLTDGGAGPNVDSMVIALVGGLFINGGDSYTITGTGTIGVGGESTFNAGSGTFLNAGVVNNGSLAVTIVPEPSRSLFALVGASAIVLSRRKRQPLTT